MSRLTDFLILIVVSFIAVFCLPQIHILLHWFGDAYQFLIDTIGIFIKGGGIMKIIRISLALTVVPLLIALIPAAIYRVFWRRWFSYYMIVVWVIWFILVTLLAYK